MWWCGFGWFGEDIWFLWVVGYSGGLFGDFCVKVSANYVMFLVFWVVLGVSFLGAEDGIIRQFCTAILL